MSNTIEITEMAPVATAIGTGRPAPASCLIGGGSALSLVSGLRGTGVVTGLAGRDGGSTRPTWAPVASETRIFGYAFAASGAEHLALLANGTEAVAQQQHSKKRAFRGLEPWRDPA